MTAQEIADQTGAHYQTIVRIVRNKVAADPSFLEGVGFRESTRKKAWDFTPEQTELIKARLKELHPDPEPKASTTIQLREWFETWVKILQVCEEGDDWTAVAAVICVLFCSQDLDLLNAVYGEGRVGDHALNLILTIDPSRLIHDTDKFSLWLQESGFKSTLPIDN